MTDDSEVGNVPDVGAGWLTRTTIQRHLQFRLCAAGDWKSSVPRHRSIQWSRLSLTRNRITRPTPRVSSPGAGFLTWRAKSRSLLCLSLWRPWRDSTTVLVGVDLEVVFSQRPSLMKSVPGFMRGACRSAMRVALTEINQGRSNGDSSRSSRVGNSSSCSHGSCYTNLHEVARCRRSSHCADSNLPGDWAHLLATSVDCPSRAQFRSEGSTC